MKAIYMKLLRAYLHMQFKSRRQELALTQAKMAEILELDIRSYSDIEKGKSLCSTVTFIMFLLYCCPDRDKLLDEIKAMLEEAGKHVA